MTRELSYLDNLLKQLHKKNRVLEKQLRETELQSTEHDRNKEFLNQLKEELKKERTSKIQVEEELAQIRSQLEVSCHDTEKKSGT